MNKKLTLLTVILTLLVITTQSYAMEGITNGIEFTHELSGGIVIETSYWSDYGNGTWKITDNKNLWLKAEIANAPMNPVEWIILIEHVHIDCTVEATKPIADGLIQDMMDDSFHGDQGGFLINKQYPYYECFSIEGYSEFLIDGWIFMWGGYGYGSISEKRLSETNLRENGGAVGSEFTVIYDVIIQPDGSDYFYKEIIYDDFIVYFDGTFEYNAGGENEPEWTKTQYVYPNWPYTVILVITGFAIIIGGAKFNNEHSGKIIVIGLAFIVIGVCLFFWGSHLVEIPVQT